MLIATFSMCLSAISYSRYYVFSLVLSLLLTVASLLLNNYLVPLYGMEGAAMSNLFSYLGYFILAIALLRITCKVSIADRKTLWIALLILAVFGINALWEQFLPIANIWISSIVRSVVLLGSGAIVAYTLRLSPELDNLIHRFLPHK